MLKKFIKDIAFIQLLNLLVKPVWILVIDRAVQNQMSQQEYGEYFALFNFSLLFFIVLDLGITSFNATQVSKHPKKLRKLFGDLFGLKILLTGLYLFLLLTCGMFMGYDPRLFSLLMLIAVVQILTSFNQYFRSSISAFQLFRSDGVFMVLDRLIMIGLVGVLLWAGLDGWELSIKRFVWAQIIGLGAVSLLSLAFIYYKIHRVSLSFSIKRVFPLLKKTWPYGLLVALMGLYNYTDGVMIEKLSIGGAEDAGVYAMGYRLFFAVFMFAQIFSNVLLPMYGKYKDDLVSIRKLSNFSARLLLLIAFSVAFISYSYRFELIEWLYPEKYSDMAVSSFSILMFSFIGSALILVYGTLLTSREKLKALNWSALATLLLNLSLNFSLIPNMGPKGAAIATLISQLIFGVSCFLICVKQLRLKWNLSVFVRLFIGLVLLFVGIIVLKQYLDSMVVHFTMITMTILITAFVIKMMDARALRSGVSK